MLTDNIRIDFSARPFRCLFVVANAAEFIAAVRVSTHLWGGRLHPILPLPRSERQEAEFARAVRRLDPDGVYVLGGGGSERIRRTLASQAKPVTRISHEQITNHANGSQPLRMQAGALPHTYQALRSVYPHGLQTSMIRTASAVDESPVLAGLYGVASTWLQEYLHKSLAARDVRPPDDAASWIRSSLLRHSVLYPADVASIGCTVSPSFHGFGDDATTPLESMMTMSPHVVFIFAPVDGDILVNCSFWNASAAAAHVTKLIIPLAIFKTDMKRALQQLFEAFVPHQIIVVAHLSERDARIMAQTIRQNLAGLSVESTIAVLRRGFAHSCLEAAIRSGRINSTTLLRDQDDRFGLAVTTPEPLEQVDAVFAVDAALTSAYGDKLALPRDESLPVTLTNEKIRINNAKENKAGLGRLWLQWDRFARPSRVGVSGITRPGLEFAFYLHPEEFVVQHVVESRGFELRASGHNRYVRGLIRRLGGLSDVLRLVRLDGLRVLDVFVYDESDQPGLLQDQLIQKLARRVDIDTKDARNRVAELLPVLLESELLLRGVGLRCPECSLQQWIRIDALGEFVRCSGCHLDFQLESSPLKSRFVLNELARRLLRTGGAAVLECASTLKAIDGSVAIFFGGEVKMPDESEGELDLVALTPSGLLFAECKSFRSPNSKGADAFVHDIRTSVGRLFHAAELAGVKDCLLCVSCHEKAEPVLETARELAEEGRTHGIDLDLILNRQYFLRCMEAREPHQLTFRNPPQLAPRKDGVIGELVSSYSFAGAPTIETDLMEEWDRQLQSF